MINILSYIGMSLQSEVCLWTLLGLLRTIFDATLFKVNANLKQVWQMKMPPELKLPVQRVLRTMISGIMLVQCFTVYVYLAAYIVLLYPVFLEERPTLVLPWLLLAAIRNLLCELTSLALGLGTCVLLGPARPPCIKFVLLKLASIMPAFYMWMLIFGYYHFLKVASAFKRFPAVLPSKDLDYGLELAVRRRKTKSLLDESQVRKKLMDSLSYCDQTCSNVKEVTQSLTIIEDEIYKNSPNPSDNDIKSGVDMCSVPVISNRTMSDIGTYEDWFGSEVNLPRDTDRILEQIVLMLLRIGVFLKKDKIDSVKFLNSDSQAFQPKPSKLQCMPGDDAETPPLVANSKGKMASYLRDYPQIFMKKPSGLLSSLSSPTRFQDNNHLFESNQYSQSSEAIEESIDSISIKGEYNEALQRNVEDKRSSRNLIHSQEEINKYFREEISNIENISNTSEKSETLQVDSKDSIASIINRMNIRAAYSEVSSKNKNKSK